MENFKKCHAKKRSQLLTRGGCLQGVPEKNFGVMDRWMPLGGCHLQEVVLYI